MTDKPIPRPPTNVNRRPGVEHADLPPMTDTERRRYQRELPPVSIADANAEPAAERVFPEPAPAKPAITFTIHALLDEFPIDVQGTGTADQLIATVARLRAIGAIPPTLAARVAAAAEQARTAPICACDICDRYQKPMKESTKNPGSYYCPGKIGTKAGQPVYCKEKA